MKNNKILILVFAIIILSLIVYTINKVASNKKEDEQTDKVVKVPVDVFTNSLPAGSVITDGTSMAQKKKKAIENIQKKLNRGLTVSMVTYLNKLSLAQLLALQKMSAAELYALYIKYS